MIRYKSSELSSKECFSLINCKTCYNRFHLPTKYRLIFVSRFWVTRGIKNPVYANKIVRSIESVAFLFTIEKLQTQLS